MFSHVPSKGAYTFPSEGITAYPSPRIPDANVLPFTSERGMISPLIGHSIAVFTVSGRTAPLSELSAAFPAVPAGEFPAGAVPAVLSAGVSSFVRIKDRTKERTSDRAKMMTANMKLLPPSGEINCTSAVRQGVAKA